MSVINVPQIALQPIDRPSHSETHWVPFSWSTGISRGLRIPGEVGIDAGVPDGFAKLRGSKIDVRKGGGAQSQTENDAGQKSFRQTQTQGFAKQAVETSNPGARAMFGDVYALG